MDEPDINIHVNAHGGVAHVSAPTVRGARWVLDNMKTRSSEGTVRISPEAVVELQAQMEQAGLTVSVR